LRNHSFGKTLFRQITMLILFWQNAVRRTGRTPLCSWVKIANLLQQTSFWRKYIYKNDDIDPRSPSLAHDFGEELKVEPTDVDDVKVISIKRVRKRCRKYDADFVTSDFDIREAALADGDGDSLPADSPEPLPVENLEPLPVESLEPLPVESLEPFPVESPGPLPADSPGPLPANSPEPLPSNSTESIPDDCRETLPAGRRSPLLRVSLNGVRCRLCGFCTTMPALIFRHKEEVIC
jgi:hypothetical protein